ncbi:MAG TPA: molybdopterin cofactor-binding domain-containing protein, partial [Gaiellaceae bacterium]|nr:molybdopterin cofactor-binding domain-containing protein [Gaiellaceae bacterium]
MSAERWVGRPVPRREDVRFLRGEATFLDDIELPGLLEAAFVRSPYAHARLGAIDVEAARAVPGVATVLTGADLGERARPLPVGAVDGGVVEDAGHPVLARDRARYAGEAVALVVAESRAVAEDAAELVEVDYEPLEPVLDARTAGGAPLLHDGVSGNRLVGWERTHGDVEGAFAGADRVVSQSFHIPRLVAAPIEPRGAIASHEPDGDVLTVWCSAQDPHRPLAQLGISLGREPDRLRVVVPDVGGAFGSKGVVAPEVAAIACAAEELARPVRWTEDRAENFLAAYQGRGLDADVELAVASDGRILGLRATLYADLGAYLYATTAVAPHTTAMLITGAYDIPAARVEVV